MSAVDVMKEKRADLKKLLGELETAQAKIAKGEGLSQTEAEALDAKVEEAGSLQAEIEAHDARVGKLNSRIEGGRKVMDPTLPPDRQPGSKGEPGVHDGDQVIKWEPKAIDGNPVKGYMTLGQYVVTAKGMQDFMAAGSPQAQFKLADVGSYLLRTKGEGAPMVPVSADMAKAALAAIESKAVPTIGTSPVVIEPTRVPELVRVTEHDRLRLRDVLDISTTSSDAVKYTRLVSYTRAAAAVANSAQKPEAALSLDAVTEAVRTIAVHMPVENQQLADLPSLAGIINGELLYDLDKHVEELVVYGDGTGENFQGIIPDPAVLACRSEVGDTLIDIARRGITDVRRAGYEPNAILVDPLDWEDIVLEKGTDNRYVWVVVTDGATQRLWAVPVIETVAMEDFAGVTTEARNLLVGDFRRGATLWDRQRSSIATGWINDQFIRNQRTILAELRAAFGVKRPGAFRKYETQAASSS